MNFINDSQLHFIEKPKIPNSVAEKISVFLLLFCLNFFCACLLLKINLSFGDVTLPNLSNLLNMKFVKWHPHCSVTHSCLFYTNGGHFSLICKTPQFPRYGPPVITLSPEHQSMGQ